MSPAQVLEQLRTGAEEHGHEMHMNLVERPARSSCWPMLALNTSTSRSPAAADASSRASTGLFLLLCQRAFRWIRPNSSLTA